MSDRVSAVPPHTSPIPSHEKMVHTNAPIQACTHMQVQLFTLLKQVRALVGTVLPRHL